MACQKVCKQGIGMMHKSKGQRIGKAPSLHPQEIRSSEIVCEAILGQKQSRSSYMACSVMHPISMYAFAKPADFEFPLQKVLRLAEQ